MLSGHNLIYFAPETWDGLWRNRHQLMSIFARHNKVLFVEGRYHLRSLVKKWRSGQVKLSDFQQPALRQVAPNLFVLRYPLWAPISGNFGAITQKIRQSVLQTALKKLAMDRPIVWFSRPNMRDLLDEVPSARLRIYHVVDEYTAYSGLSQYRAERIAQAEQTMLTNVDMVVVVSPKLYEAKRPYNPNTYLVANGVDFSSYSQALANPTLPDALLKIKEPRLGYIGLIGDKLNLTMVKDLVENRPEWSLVLLGTDDIAKQAATWTALKVLPNVHHLKPVAADQVANYVKGFQVGLMPYKQNQHADNISPLKLYDYLAAGLPIAAVDIPAVRAFGDHVHIADAPPAFSAAVAAALADQVPERRQARRDLAAHHTWEARVEQLSHLIESHMAVKSG
ncbi:MAG: glycosyltransferase [Anaerolineae bacterium]|nr:glycosyltransferase [Anaerolineae bacterium]